MAIDNNINTTWSSIYYSYDNRFANEWIKIDTGGLRGLKRVTVTPRQPQEYCYNGDFYLEVSPDGTNWVKPDYDFREYRLRTTYNKYVFDFKDTIYARYVRLTSNSLYLDQNYSCYFQIGEIDIEQITLSATASSTLNSDWAVTNILDDVVSRCWSSQYSASENSTEWVYIDTGTPRQISGVRVKPRPGGLCFPKDFKFQYSTNGTSWTDVSGQSYTNYPDPGSNEQSFVFGSAVNARYIRLYATKLRADQYGNYYCQIADFVADMEIKRIATASSNLSGWEPVKVTDAIAGTYWSSQYRSSENNTEWIYADLGSSQKVSGLRVAPRPQGCFPKDFKIQYSADASTWTDVVGQSYVNYYNPGSTIQKFVFSDLVSARYIRIYATKLRPDDGGNHYFQLGEMFVDP
jgi:hypothetical protein